MELLSKEYTEEEYGFSGYFEGYIVNPKKENNLIVFLESEFASYQLISAVKKINDDILVVKNIFIDEDFRGQGFGSEVFEEIISHSLNNKIILCADTDEVQNDGFDLIKFYQSYGFDIIERSESNPFMVSEELKQDILKNKQTRKIKR